MSNNRDDDLRASYNDPDHAQGSYAGDHAHVYHPANQHDAGSNGRRIPEFSGGRKFECGEDIGSSERRKHRNRLPAEPIEQLRHGCIGTCSRDQDIQYEWYEELKNRLQITSLKYLLHGISSVFDGFDLIKAD